MAAHLRLEGLRRAFGPVVAVEDLSLDIRQGELLTLLGPSGSGKTTTLMMIAGFEPPDAGRILLQGEEITHRVPNERNLGVVFQSYALFPHMSVFENVAFPLRIRRRPEGEIRARVREALGLVQLQGLELRTPRQLSGGQQQRVALARALVFEPPVLLMDEPLGALDRKLREEMQLELKGLQEKLGVTIIYVTHDQAEALTLSHRIAVMNHGRLQQVGTPAELYERPANRFVASFIGESNLFEGRVEEAGGGILRVRTAAGGRLAARDPGAVGRGDRVVVAVRPEKVYLGLPPADAANRFPAEVIEAIYVGDTTRYALAIPGLGNLVVRVQNIVRRPPHGRGARVEVGWDAGEAVALRED